jgi:hypothetical protein
VKKKSSETGKNQHEESEMEAAKRVVPWTQICPNDYRFKWASNESKENKEFLRAGCVYKYTRESRKLRCLLVLINSAFQKALQAEKTQTRPPFQGLQFLSLSFEGLRYKDALLRLGGWFGWLRTFTNELAANTSFAELCKENREQLNESLSTLPEYFYAPRAVELAFPGLNESLVEPRLLWPCRHPMLVIGTSRMTLLSRFESDCAISRTRRSGRRWKSGHVCFGLPQKKNQPERAQARGIARVLGLMLYLQCAWPHIILKPHPRHWFEGAREQPHGGPRQHSRFLKMFGLVLFSLDRQSERSMARFRKTNLTDTLRALGDPSRTCFPSMNPRQTVPVGQSDSVGK